jgi:curli biogenesis system outer membrane secretion channel CsgG
MNRFRMFTLIIILAVMMLFPGCAGVKTEDITVNERPVTAVDQAPKTMAVLPFENNSVTDPDRYAPLSKGLSAMLITDLQNSSTSLRLIERDKIQALLKEIALSQSGIVDQSTAVRAGKILGAQSIVFGSFMVLGSQVRMDARIIKVETSEVVMAESVVGGSGGFMNLAMELAGKIARSMKVAFKPLQIKSEGDINAALYFSKGLDALDRGDKKEARRLFSKCIELDPAYKTQVNNVKDLN